MDEADTPQRNADEVTSAKATHGLPRASWKSLAGPGVHWIWVSIGLYIIACFLPAMPPIMGTQKLTGWDCLMTFFYFIPAWWANPVYFLTLILNWRRCRRAATICACLAVVLAVSFQFIGFPNPGWTEGITDAEPGCYVWIISMQLLAINLIWQEWRSQTLVRHGSPESGDVGRPAPSGIRRQPGDKNALDC